MHELSIVEALIEQVDRELHRAGQTGRVVELNLAVGRLSGVHSGSLRFAFELLSPGSVVEGAQMNIAEPKAACRCRDCGHTEPIDELVAQCPKCGSDHVVIEGGRELTLDSIELEPDGP
ncbi:MAG: hydrogenase maturation nickel metallochaperone HypA [Thermoguttaceae bacterium]|jgi:hydrogenase nickel incorporation protein HypA/HybF|nr:hydrogenase maturation nickel metallochaperone HypA [Thermoguttaceae bacterium]